MLYEPKFIQIAAGTTAMGECRLFALDKDGNVWELEPDDEWRFIGSPAGINK